MDQIRKEREDVSQCRGLRTSPLFLPIKGLLATSVQTKGRFLLFTHPFVHLYTYPSSYRLIREINQVFPLGVSSPGEEEKREGAEAGVSIYGVPLVCHH